MARVKTKKKVAEPKTDLDIVMALHPDLPWQDDEEDAKTAKSAEQTTIAELQAKLAALEAQVAAPKNDVLPYLTSQAIKPLPPRVITELDTKGLPDPTVEPEKYASEMARRTKEMLDSQAAYARWEADQAATENNKASALWNKFKETYPDYAEDYEQVEYFATKAAKDAAALGLDVDKYMFLHSDKFMKDVVTKMDEVLGPKGGKADEEVDDEPEVRTAGIFGGNESGGRPNKGAEGPDMDPFKTVRDFQLRTGFHG